MHNAPPETPRLLDDFFRRQYSRCVAHLTRHLGHQQLALAEEAVQEALVRALRVWPLKGIPDRPEAWVLQVAYRHALDLCRKDRRHQELMPRLVASLDPLPQEAQQARLAGELHNDTLAMMFMCCHPSLSPLSRVALTLKVVSGFGVPEIARACFAAQTTVAQRIVRAKSRLRDLDIAMEVPPPEQLPPRLNSVLDVLYLLFNEGYTCRDGEEPLQIALIDESLRLLELLLGHPLAAGQPHAHALAALLYFQSSRIEARLDEGGRLLPLWEQDRGLWDRGRIAQGLRHLEQATGGQALTEYHLLAGIAACHATSPSHEATPWRRIASLYDDLVALNGTFVTQLNRAVAHGQAFGPERGLELLDALSQRKALQEYHLLAAARADGLTRLGRYEEAKSQLEIAADLAPSPHERELFLAQAQQLQAAQELEQQGVALLPSALSGK